MPHCELTHSFIQCLRDAADVTGYIPAFKGLEQVWSERSGSLPKKP